MPQTLHAILFDLDDTLIDWGDFFDDWESIESRHVRSVYQHIRKAGYMLGGVTQFTQEYMRRTRSAWVNARSTLEAPHVGKVLVETAEAMGVPKGELVQEECLHAYGWGRAEGVTVFPDVPPMLEELIAHNIKIGIVTNAFQPMWMRDRELAEHGLLDYFPDCRISAADVGRLKPDSRIFHHALQRIDAAPEHVVFIGDNLSADIGGAKKVGMKAVLRKRRVQRYMRHAPPPIEPDATVDSFTELPAILDKWFPDWRQGQA